MVFLTLFFPIVGYSLNVAACEQVPSGQSFRIRLLSPVASYSSKRGMPVQAVMIQSPQCDGAPIFPLGTPVEGQIKSIRKVGMGFRHETASVEIVFDRISPPGVSPIPIQAEVVEVDNAKEQVKNNVIRGVRSSDTFQSRVTMRLIQLPTWDPDGLLFLAARRALFPAFPEPEIYFPRGTDFHLKLAAPLEFAEDIPATPGNPQFNEEEKDELDDIVQSRPSRAVTPGGRDGDIVNLAFLGSREQLENAFHAAGWIGSDPVSTRSVLRQIYAVTSLNNYRRLPISKQLLEGRMSEFSWQKSFNSYAKRDHLRIWSEPDSWLGQPAWLSGSVAEVSAGLSPQKGLVRFTHRLDSDLDKAREKVVRDLTLAGCVDAVYDAERPDVPRFAKSPTGDEVETDGLIAVVRLKDCERPIVDDSLPVVAPPFRPKSRFVRYLRTQILTFRSDLWRANAVYAAFDLTRAAIRATRTTELPALDVQAP